MAASWARDACSVKADSKGADRALRLRRERRDIRLLRASAQVEVVRCCSSCILEKSSGTASFTWLSGQLFQIDLHGEIIALLRRAYYIMTVFALKHVLSSVLDELGETLDGERDEDLSLGLWESGNVVSHIVEVGDDLVN